MIDEDLIQAWVKSDVYQHIVTKSNNKTHLAYWLKAVFRNDSELEEHLNPDFAFKAENDWHNLSDILIAWKKVTSCEAEWIIGGTKEVTGPYIGFQKSLSRHDRFIEFQIHKLRR